MLMNQSLFYFDIPKDSKEYDNAQDYTNAYYDRNGFYIHDFCDDKRRIYPPQKYIRTRMERMKYEQMRDNGCPFCSHCGTQMVESIDADIPHYGCLLCGNTMVKQK